jgi:hypothetical protein
MEESLAAASASAAVSVKTDFEKVCELGLQFDDYWMGQHCSDRIGVLMEMSKWYRQNLLPSLVMKKNATTSLEKEAQKIYPKYYNHLQALSGKSESVPTGFFDMKKSKSVHSTKPILFQKLGVANDAWCALKQWIASKNEPQIAANIWENLKARFQKWLLQQTDANNSCSDRVWPLFATIALARGTDGDSKDVAKLPPSQNPTNSWQPFVHFDDPQMGMTKLLQVPLPLCALKLPPQSFRNPH